jgi:hypothetical protein
VRGDFVHNAVLVGQLAALLSEFGIAARQEFPIQIGTRRKFADLYAQWPGVTLVCEAELSADRVWNDLEKAVAAQATLLMIVVPNANVARRARHRLSHPKAPSVPTSLTVCVLTLGIALQRLRRLLTLMSSVIGRRTLNHQIPTTVYARGKRKTSRREGK